MIAKSRWREVARPIIARVLSATAGKSKPEIDSALRDAYPFGERRYHPYKIWLDEIKRQRGVLHPIGHKRAWENNQLRIKGDFQRLQEWETLYGKRQA